MHMLSRQISTSRTTSLTARTLLSEAFKQFHPGRSGFLFHSAPVFNSRQSHESSCRVFQCFVFSWWSQWGLFMGSLFCLCVDVLVGGSICPSLTSAALALWSCSLCFSSLFSVLVWGLPSMFFRNFRRSGRWWVAWVATTNACAEQVTHTTSTSSSVGNPNFFCTSLCIGCFCCCKVWAATLKKPSSHMQNSLLAPTLDPPSSSSFGIRKMSKRLDRRKQWKPSEWSGHHMASTKHGLLLEGSCWAE